METTPSYLIDADEKARRRKYLKTPERITAMGGLDPVPATPPAGFVAKFIAAVDELSGTHWDGARLVRHRELTPEDRDELLRDKRDAERARYGYGSGE